MRYARQSFVFVRAENLFATWWKKNVLPIIWQKYGCRNLQPGLSAITFFIHASETKWSCPRSRVIHLILFLLIHTLLLSCIVLGAENKVSVLFLEIKTVLCDPAAYRNLFHAEGQNTRQDRAMLQMASALGNKVCVICIVFKGFVCVHPYRSGIYWKILGYAIYLCNSSKVVIECLWTL